MFPNPTSTRCVLVDVAISKSLRIPGEARVHRRRQRTVLAPIRVAPTSPVRILVKPERASATHRCFAGDQRIAAQGTQQVPAGPLKGSDAIGWSEEKNIRWRPTRISSRSARRRTPRIGSAFTEIFAAAGSLPSSTQGDAGMAAGLTGLDRQEATRSSSRANPLDTRRVAKRVSRIGQRNHPPAAFALNPENGHSNLLHSCRRQPRRPGWTLSHLALRLYTTSSWRSDGCGHALLDGQSYASERNPFAERVCLRS